MVSQDIFTRLFQILRKMATPSLSSPAVHGSCRDRCMVPFIHSCIRGVHGGLIWSPEGCKACHKGFMGASCRPMRVPRGAMVHGNLMWGMGGGVHGRPMGDHDGAMGCHGAPQIPATPKTFIFLRLYKVFAHPWGIHGGIHTGPWGSQRGPK